MVGEGVSANSSFKHVRGVRILFGRAEVEHPVVPPMPMVQELLDILSSIAVVTFYTDGRIPHDDHSICDIRQVCSKLQNERYVVERAHRMDAPSSRSSSSSL